MIPHSRPWFNDSHLQYANQVLHSKDIVYGKIAKEFENNLATYLNKKYAFSFGNGTQALYAILNSLEIGIGDEVIIPSYVCNKIYYAIIQCGAKPILCDIDKNYCMNYDTIYEKTSKHTKAIILVHMFGINAWDKRLLDFKIPIIEDICQSFGNLEEENKTGTFSDFAFTSFHAIKCLPIGYGGMAFVNNLNLANKIQQLYNQNPLLFHMSDVQCALGQSMFEEYEEILKKRKFIAKYYQNHIDNKLNNHYEINMEKSMHYRYVINSKKSFSSIKNYFFENGIHVRQGVDSLIHQQINKSDEGFENTLNTFNTTISIPILPDLTMEEMDLIVNTTNSALENNIL